MRDVSLKKRIVIEIGIVTILIALSVTMATAVTFQKGDVFAGVGNGVIRHYDGAGNFIENLTIPGIGFTEDTGMAFDSSGNLYATVFQAQNVSKFDNSGGFLNFFGSGYNADPESIVFDASGNAYVGQADGTRKILKFDPTGNPLANFTPITGPRGTDWIDLASDQCTIYYTSEGSIIRRFNVCTNNQSTDFASDLHGAAFALRIQQNGEVLVADSQDVHRLNASGNTIQTYAKPANETSFLFALNLDPDGTSFWTAGYSSGKVYKFDISTGDLLLTIDTKTQGPIVTLAGLAIFGEITAAIPTEGKGNVTGGGWIYSTANNKSNFGFVAHFTDNSTTPSGNLQYNDKAAGLKVHGNITTLSVDKATNTSIFTGTAKITNTTTTIVGTYKVIAVDNGEPGKNDMFDIALSTGYAANNTLGGGNIQLHDP